MEGKKPLCLTDGFESTHLSFPLTRRLMRSLHAIVGVTLGVSHVAGAVERLLTVRTRKKRDVEGAEFQ
jgi:hypothetical protein